MAYEKTIWKDQDVENPRTYSVRQNLDGTITLLDAFGDITEPGTPVNAENMNNIEEGIANSIDKTNITNCITEIPQDIKLELADGVLTLKAGSKVYVPNGKNADGSNKFDEKLVNSDVSWNFGSNTNTVLVFLGANNTGQFRFITQAYSGTSDSATVSTTYYNTSTNIITSHNNGGDLVVSLPLAAITVTNGSVTSIDQVFNGFGFIGSTIFALPGVSGLIPNGRNDDGTLRSIEFVTDKVITKTFTSTATTQYSVMFLKQNEIGEATGLYYDESTNLNYWGANAPADNCFVGTITLKNGVISNFAPKTAFHALDYNDFYNELNNKFKVVSTLPANPVAGTFYYIPE